MALDRFPDWDQRLARFIESRRRRHFSWGKHDCCMFAADAAKVITGKDLAAEFRGRYRTALGAKRKINAYGGLREVLTAVLGEPKSILAASRGDLVLIPADGFRESVGVCIGGRSIFAGEQGVVIRDNEAHWPAWTV